MGGQDRKNERLRLEIKKQSERNIVIKEEREKKSKC